MPTLERVWIAYLLTVIAVSTLAAPEHDPSHAPMPFLLVQATLLGTALSLHLVGPQLTEAVRRFWHCVLVVVGLPAVFSSLGWILPAVHPEPYEWTWIRWDRALFGGGDPSVMAQSVLSPWFTELLQWVYASFYFIPIAAVIGAAKSHGPRAFDRALTTIVFCFLFSYLGYLLWPTLPPYRFFYYEQPLQGLWITENLRQIINGYELNHWDCFPSGHTMLTLVSVVVCWRYARKLLPVLIPIAGLMIFSTVALRYHYVIDVLAGIAFVWPAVWLCDRLFAMDAAEPGIPAGAAPLPDATMAT